MVFQKIKDLREDNDLTQQDIASELNISQRAYSHYENGTRNLPVEVLIQLSEFYNVSTDYILGLSSKK
ncbi:MAG: helix-turn-helix domain-containing protein [Lachnospiraceae bacterium]|nr:helix-turn-helix domain-containing protein [Lachnospiraceae bacterium]